MAPPIAALEKLKSPNLNPGIWIGFFNFGHRDLEGKAWAQLPSSVTCELVTEMY